MGLDFDTLIGTSGVLVAVGSLIFVLFQLKRSQSLRADRKVAIRHPEPVPFTEVHAFQLRPEGATSCRIGAISGDIRLVKRADIWVNAENTDMEMARFDEDAVSAIIRYLGAQRDAGGHPVSDLIADELVSVVGTERPVAPGSAFVTGSGYLKDSNNVRYIIHVAAVQGEPGAGFRQVQNVGLCVTNALIEADRLAIKSPPLESILFPLLGTGVGRAEVEPTIRTLIGAAINYLDQTPNTALKVIYFLTYTNVELETFMNVVRSMPRLGSVEIQN